MEFILQNCYYVLNQRKREEERILVSILYKYKYKYKYIYFNFLFLPLCDPCFRLNNFFGETFVAILQRYKLRTFMKRTQTYNAAGWPSRWDKRFDQVCRRFYLTKTFRTCSVRMFVQPWIQSFEHLSNNAHCREDISMKLYLPVLQIIGSVLILLL